MLPARAAGMSLKILKTRRSPRNGSDNVLFRLNCFRQWVRGHVAHPTLMSEAKVRQDQSLDLLYSQAAGVYN